MVLAFCSVSSVVALLLSMDGWVCQYCKMLRQGDRLLAVHEKLGVLGAFCLQFFIFVRLCSVDLEFKRRIPQTNAKPQENRFELWKTWGKLWKK